MALLPETIISTPAPCRTLAASRGFVQMVLPWLRCSARSRAAGASLFAFTLLERLPSESFIAIHARRSEISTLYFLLDSLVYRSLYPNIDTLVYVILPREVCLSGADINNSPRETRRPPALTHLLVDTCGMILIRGSEVRDAFVGSIPMVG